MTFCSFSVRIHFALGFQGVKRTETFEFSTSTIDNRLYSQSQCLLNAIWSRNCNEKTAIHVKFYHHHDIQSRNLHFQMQRVTKWTNLLKNHSPVCCGTFKKEAWLIKCWEILEFVLWVPLFDVRNPRQKEFDFKLKDKDYKSR